MSRVPEAFPSNLRMCRPPESHPGRLAAALQRRRTIWTEMSRRGRQWRCGRDRSGAPADRTDSPGCFGATARLKCPRHRNLGVSRGVPWPTSTGSWKASSQQAERTRKLSRSTDATKTVWASSTSTCSRPCWKESKQPPPAGAAPSREWAARDGTPTEDGASGRLGHRPAWPRLSTRSVPSPSRASLPQSMAQPWCVGRSKRKGSIQALCERTWPRLDAVSFNPCCEESSTGRQHASWKGFQEGACAANPARGQRWGQEQRQSQEINTETPPPHPPSRLECAFKETAGAVQVQARSEATRLTRAHCWDTGDVRGLGIVFKSQEGHVAEIRWLSPGGTWPKSED